MDGGFTSIFPLEHLLLLHRIELDTPWLSFDVGGYLVLSGALAENNIPGFGEYKIHISLVIKDIYGWNGIG